MNGDLPARFTIKVISKAMALLIVESGLTSKNQGADAALLRNGTLPSVLRLCFQATKHPQ